MHTTIVLVDDQPDKRFLLERFLRKEFPDNPLISFADCAEAVAIVMAPIPKIIVTNGRIAFKDGLEFTSFIYDEVKAPVVIVSLREEMEEKAMAAGASAFIETGDKPSILKAITEASKKRRSRDLHRPAIKPFCSSVGR